MAPHGDAQTGEKQSWLGCDLYTFRRGLIVMKDTYIKVVGLTENPLAGNSCVSIACRTIHSVTV